MYYDRDRLKSILKDGFVRESPNYYELELLATHFREKGYGKAGIRKRLIEKAKELYPRFNRVLYFEEIEKAVRQAMKKNKIPDMWEVVIYKEELDKIRGIRNFKSQLIIFSMLVTAKSYPEWGYNSVSSWETDIKNVLSLSGTRVTYKKFLREYRKKLEEFGLLRYIIYRRGRLKAKYLLPFALKEGKTPLFTFSTKEHIAECAVRYKEWTGGELFWCSDCGEENIRTSPRQLRCSDCAVERKNERSKDYMRKKRSAK